MKLQSTVSGRKSGKMGKRCLVFGTTGQVAQELIKQVAREPSKTQFIFVGRDRADLAQVDQTAALIRELSPALVMNTAAYTKVDLAESQREMAMMINADAPAAMAAACRDLGIPLIHVSTDYVFDGTSPIPWREDDKVAPRSAYGASKGAGERAVRTTLDRHIILRTAWVFSSTGNNFVKTMLRLGNERDELRIVDDQYGGPTWAGSIAQAMLSMAEDILTNKQATWGTYHFCGAPRISWFGLAQAIFAEARRPPPRLVPISTREYPTPARRPANSMLDCTKIARDWGIEQPDWRQGIITTLAELQSISTKEV